MTKTCSVEKCKRRSVAHTLCDLHYRRWKKYGATDLPEPEPRTSKLCARCKKVFLISEFYVFRNKDGNSKFSSYCNKCLAEKSRERRNNNPEERKRQSLYLKKWRKENADWVKERSRIKTAETRKEVINAYGGKCRCCSEDTPEFMAIDHVYNDGAYNRREKKHPASGSQFYVWLKKQGFPQDRFQLLCHNCNLAKSLYGKCPHQIINHAQGNYHNHPDTRETDVADAPRLFDPAA